MSKISKPVSLAPVKILATPIAATPAVPPVSVSDANPAPAMVKIHQPVAVAEMAAKPVSGKPEATSKFIATSESITTSKAAADGEPAVVKSGAVKSIAEAAPTSKSETVVAAKAPAVAITVSKSPVSKPTDIKPVIAAKVQPPKAVVSKPVPATAIATKPAAPAKPLVRSKPHITSKPLVTAKPVVTVKPVAAAAPSIAASNPMAAFAGMFDPKAMLPGLTLPGLTLPGLTLPGFTSADLKMPSFGPDMITAMASQIVNATRALGEVQAALLDHGVAQLKAGMNELEECARSTTPSEVVVIQARAIRRSADDLTTTIKAVSAKTGKGFIKG